MAAARKSERNGAVIVNRSHARAKNVAGERNGAAIVNPSYLEIERRRRAAGVSQARLVAAAGIGWRTWQRARAGHTELQRGTIYKLNRALERLAGAPAAPAPDIIAAFFRSATLAIEAEIGADAELIAATTVTRDNRQRDPREVAAGRLRRLAIYITTVELQVENVTLADAIGCSRQNVQQARGSVENLRDNPLVDQLLERCAAKLTGRTQ